MCDINRRKGSDMKRESHCFTMGMTLVYVFWLVVNVQNPSTAHPRRVKPFMQGGQQQQRSACFYSAFPSEQAVNLCPDPPYLGACLPPWSRDKGISPPTLPTTTTKKQTQKWGGGGGGWGTHTHTNAQIVLFGSVQDVTAD